MTSITRYTAGRLTKAMTSRSRDATFSGIGGAMRGLAGRGFSLIQGREVRGYAVGVDGYTARMLDPTPTTLLGQLSTNELVYACVRERCKFLIQPNFIVERRQPDGTYVAEDDHDLTALIRRPGPTMDTATFWRCLEVSYSSVGRAYMEPMRTMRGRQLEGLNPLNPVYMHEQIEQGVLQYYEWRPPDAPWVRYAPDELIVRRAVDWADVPPLVAALGAVEADELSATFLRGFFASGGVPSGVIKVRGTWNEELTTAFRSKWMERFGPGILGAGGPAILDENIISYDRIGVSTGEMDNQNIIMRNETRVCMCYGISPLIIYSMAGLIRAIESNLAEAWENTWDATALPLLKEWSNWITWALLIHYESPDDILLGNVRCRFDPTGIGPYQEDVAAKVAQYLEGFKARGVTLNEYRLALGLAPLAGGDVIEKPVMPDFTPDQPEQEKAVLLEMPT